MAQKPNQLSKFGIRTSKDITEKNIKFLFWGDTGSRKTETVLRYFPHVLVIDTEGNTDHCVDVPEIPEFLQIKTKDARAAKEIIEAVARGEIRFPDGSAVETISIDGVSVLWNVQKEVGSKLAEKRAARYNQDTAEATMTQLDWTVAKRPLNELMTLINNSGIKYLVLTAREADEYEERQKNGSGKKELVKIGFKPDTVKGTEYEVNVALHFIRTERGWKWETTKVQGGLAKVFPDSGSGTAFPAKELFAYASSIKPPAPNTNVKTDEQIAEEIATQEAEKAAPKTQAALMAFAKEKGFTPAELGALLKANGISGFDPANWEQMISLIKENKAGAAEAEKPF